MIPEQAQAGARVFLASGSARAGCLPLGINAIDAALPLGGLPRGALVELRAQGWGSAATSLALCACRAAQEAARTRGTSEWCAFVDPTATLSALGVKDIGVNVARLLVVRPPRVEMADAALRVAQACAFSVIVVDCRRSPEARGSLPAPAAQWLRALALEVAGTSTCVLLLTEAGPALERHGVGVERHICLRLELTRVSPRELELCVAPGDGGAQLGPRRRVEWSALFKWSALAAISASAPTHANERRAREQHGANPH